MASDIQPGLLRKMTVRSVFEKLQQNGPFSRADLTRETGISAPTVSKVVAELIEQGLVEETDVSENLLGRPGKRLRIAKQGSRVVGVTIGQFFSGVTTAAIDGEVDVHRAFSFPTPSNYQTFVELLADCVKKIQETEGFRLLGVGVCVPGLISRQSQIVVHSELAPFLVGRSLSADLSNLAGIQVATRPQGQSLAMAERLFGHARWLRDFVMVDMADGPTLGIYSDGDLIAGRDGLAGQISPPAMLNSDDSGKRQVTTDSDFLAAVCERIGRHMSLDQLWQECQSGAIRLEDELELACHSMAKVVASAINLLNPATLFVHSRILAFEPSLLSRIADLARSQALDASFGSCQLLAASVSVQTAAMAAITDSLTQSLGPRLS
ncbi:MAG: ROK family transcriptional regulator [Planctomycetaceae bacterium]|nr:ROK family transcriptional regulator [Planctomycetaceae bacterium]